MPLQDGGGIPIPVRRIPGGTGTGGVFGDVERPKVLDVVRIDQVEDAWCYAACTAMVINFLRGLGTVERCAVASFVKSGLGVEVDCCNTNEQRCLESGCTVGDFNLIFAEASLTANRPITGHPSNPQADVLLPDLQQEYDDGRPVLVRVEWHDYGAHALLVTGVDGFDVHLIDPLNDDHYGGWRPIGELFDGFGQGRWTETWLGLQ